MSRKAPPPLTEQEMRTALGTKWFAGSPESEDFIRRRSSWSRIGEVMDVVQISGLQHTQPSHAYEKRQEEEIGRIFG